jgi:hypothetical protein
MQAQIDQLTKDREVQLAKIAELEATPAAPASAAAKRVKAAYKVPKGEEGYHHVLITHQGGEALAEPVVKAFEPHQYETSVSKFPGFKGEIIHKAVK